MLSKPFVCISSLFLKGYQNSNFANIIAVTIQIEYSSSRQAIGVAILLPQLHPGSAKSYHICGTIWTSIIGSVVAKLSVSRSTCEYIAISRTLHHVGIYQV